MNPNEFLLKLQEDQYKGYITAEELEKEMDIVAEQTKTRLLKKYQEELSPEEVKQYERDIEMHSEELKKIKTPTKYENPETYALLLELSSIIQSGISSSHVIHQETRKVIKLTDLNYNFTTPSFGTIAFGDINARTYPCENNEHLIVFQTEFTTFCYLICKIIIQLIPDYVSTTENTFEDYKKMVQEKIVKNPDTVKRFKELIIAYVTTGRATRSPIYEISSKYNQSLAGLSLAMEVFAMGHEYSHILIGHTTEESLKKKYSLEESAQTFYSQFQEYEADHLAFSLTLEGLHNIGMQNDFVNYAGAESFFSALEIFQRAKCIVEVGDDTWYWKRGGKSTGKLPDHPPSDERREKLRNQARFVYGEKFLLASKITEYIIKTLYEKIKPDLVGIYNNS